MSIISCTQYIAEYLNRLQCSTIGLSTQSKYVCINNESLLLDQVYSTTILTFTHDTHVDDDTKHHLNTLISNNCNVCVGNNRNTIFQYRQPYYTHAHAHTHAI